VPRWSHSRVQIICDDGSPDHEDDDADVGIEDGQIVVSYMDDEGPVVLAGRVQTPGHFDLVARSRLRRATLVRSADGRTLAGAWSERERRGNWLVELGPACDAGSDP
jgi:hypothetical protein